MHHNTAQKIAMCAPGPAYRGSSRQNALRCRHPRNVGGFIAGCHAMRTQQVQPRSTVLLPGRCAEHTSV